MKTDKINSINYQGKFLIKSNLNKQDRTYINQLLHTSTNELNSCSNSKIVETMPFNVEISSLYKTKRHKHSKLVFKTKFFPFFSFITINSKNVTNRNINKIKNFISKFNADIKSY